MGREQAHKQAEDGMTAAIHAASPQTEAGRLTAAVDFVISGLTAMKSDGSTVDDFVDALDHIHSGRQAIKKLVTG